MLNYVGQAPFSVAMVASVVAGLVFAYPALTGSAGASGGPPQFALATALVAHAPKETAPILGLTADELVAGLQNQGFTAVTADGALSEAAAKSGKSPVELMAALNGLKK